MVKFTDLKDFEREAAANKEYYRLQRELLKKKYPTKPTAPFRNEEEKRQYNVIRSKAFEKLCYDENSALGELHARRSQLLKELNSDPKAIKAKEKALAKAKKKAQAQEQALAKAQAQTQTVVITMNHINKWHDFKKKELKGIVYGKTKRLNDQCPFVKSAAEIKNLPNESHRGLSRTAYNKIRSGKLDEIEVNRARLANKIEETYAQMCSDHNAKRPVTIPGLARILPELIPVTIPAPVVAKKSLPVQKSFTQFGQSHTAASKLYQAQEDPVDCIDSSYDSIVDIFLECKPERLPFLSHIIHVEKQQSFTIEQYKRYIVPLMFEELKSQVVTQFQEHGAEVSDANGELIFNSALMRESSLDMQVQSLVDNDGQSVALSFRVKIKSLVDEIVYQDLVMITATHIATGAKQRVLAYISKVSKLMSTSLNQFCTATIQDTKEHCQNFVRLLYDNRLNGAKASLSLSLCKVSNFITFHRELVAVHGLSSTVLAKQILTPSLDPGPANKKYTLSDGMVKVLKTVSTLNDSQFQAVEKCMESKGITLIQGPPGTGKTKTILALLSVFRNVGPLKILVCAPSNTAVDEIGVRVLDQGLISQTGEVMRPKVVRLGQLKAVSPALHSICLEQLPKLSEKKQALRDANIVLGTLSASGSKSLNGQKFDLVIVDEATQSVEPSSLIPLTMGAGKLIMIGDTRQLPPTVFSMIADRYGYSVSLFERLSEVFPTHMLTVQYRMHPLISSFPSMTFYGGEVKDGKTEEQFQQPFYKDSSRFGPINFYDILDSREEACERSLRNKLEVELVFLLIKRLVHDYPETKKMSFGVITPYKLQFRELEAARRNVFNVKDMDIKVNTVDGFQGGEKDIIILSCVRQDRIGFLSDRRRMNVGITRARFAHFVIGHGALLQKDKLWGPYINHIKRNCHAYNVIDSKGIRTMGEIVKHNDINNPEGLITEHDRELDNLEQKMIEEEQHAINEVYGDDDDDSSDESGDDNDTVNQDISVLLAKMTLGSNSKSNYNDLLDNTHRCLDHIKRARKDESDVDAKRRQMKQMRSVVKEHVLKLERILVNPNTNGATISTTLSDELMALYTSSLSPKNTAMKQKALTALEKLLQQNFKGCSVTAYGSFVSGIQLHDSDIDVCMSYKHNDVDKDLMRRVALVLLKAGYKVDKLIGNARVPIIRFKSPDLQVPFDLCFNNMNAVTNSLLIRSYTEQDKRVKPLIILIKYWAAQKNINDTLNNTLSSYSYANMVIHYLQTCQPPVLPNLQDKARDKTPKVSNTQSLGQLFYGFFQYFSSFDFKKQLIAIRHGKEMSVRMATLEYLDTFKHSHICIEDPIDHKHNPAGSVNKRSFPTILYEIRIMEHNMRTNPSSSAHSLLSKSDLQSILMN
ncbi:hypothetical protein SAMD00019534_099440 [Acytostelium subglobosum LB1]|uniref:hypothetical protein n=1 Tax=Acytostelium subglobosum LB1 TaxID=1410327 RepID=UPI0006449254|nr:hypothetical protein SAMD00019534_099440 [Acytostelium subglobosum LB1]GAM26769.1 hypothetical protein SAMD00019534_099440 [Acytostelium subglobosum LB1]|eukprot:XP_012750430.1 hypothetical protein SAMD00019534_099440 [Acytostelium subglobosum LB1]